MYKHYYRCGLCGKHVTSLTEGNVPSPPALRHDEALEEGGRPAASGDPLSTTCIGQLSFCSGAQLVDKANWQKPESYRNCVPAHAGTVYFAPAPEPAPNPDWTDFAGRVGTAWAAFVAGGYAPALRGVNNNREYKAPAKVKQVLQGSGGAVTIGDAVYTISNSLHAGVSLHRPIPAAYQIGNMRSFIFHL